MHDSQAALPLARMSNDRVIYLYELMDSAYDSEIIRDQAKKYGHVALTDYNNRGASPAKRRYFAPHEKERYKARSTAERANSELKDSYTVDSIWVKGHVKVFCHVMLAVLALTIKQVIYFSSA